MAIMITDECINCGACEPECPNNAIYEGGVEWAISDGNTVRGAYTLKGGISVDAETKNTPVDCCVPDPEHVETSDELLDRKARLHL